MCSTKQEQSSILPKGMQNPLAHYSLYIKEVNSCRKSIIGVGCLRSENIFVGCLRSDHILYCK